MSVDRRLADGSFGTARAFRSGLARLLHEPFQRVSIHVPHVPEFESLDALLFQQQADVSLAQTCSLASLGGRKQNSLADDLRHGKSSPDLSMFSDSQYSMRQAVKTMNLLTIISASSYD
jgi:hypothetical protein